LGHKTSDFGHADINADVTQTMKFELIWHPQYVAMVKEEISGFKTQNKS